jgi:hypothetical protein
MLPGTHSPHMAAISTGVLQADMRVSASMPVSRANWRRLIQAAMRS